MLAGVDCEIINRQDAGRLAEVRAFLVAFGLTFDGEMEYTVLLRQDGKLIGTGSFSGEVLRNIAVDEAVQGEGLTAKIISVLLQEQSRRGRFHYFIFTKPAYAHLFEKIGFKTIAKAEPYAALLETGLGSVKTYCESIAKQTIKLKEKRAAIVVNCNPFTKGHEALIKQASRENDAVIVFVVTEDRSLFPFRDRFRLVRDGVADLNNVVVVPADKYIVSAATFPSYFTRDEDRVIAQARLDVELFATQIAPRLGIIARYVGDEPYCPVTNTYNEAMREILPKHSIHLKLIGRFEIDGEAVSASKVRDMIRCDDWETIRAMVPSITLSYLMSPEAKSILEKIKNTNSRH